MRKIYALLVLCCLCIPAFGQVTQMYTDYNNFWNSRSTSINSVKPNLSHNLLAFRWNNTIYSTGVDDTKLNNNGLTYVHTKFRALPITTVPVSGGSSYFIGFGALTDGIANGVSTTQINPHITTGAQKAKYLTDGLNGLDIGTCLTNIPAGSTLTFNLSINGITLANVNDGIPDILVSQIAEPASVFDELYFVDANNVQVGNVVSIRFDINATYPTVGNWTADFYNNNSTATAGFVNTDRPFKFFAVDLATFGININNYASARKLIYKPSGQSDPAFLAYNEPSIGVAQQLVITSQPTSSDCNGNMPSSFVVRLADSFGDPVEQAGYEISASMYTGPGELLGTLTATTNAQGIATFSTLQFEVGGDHVIRFDNTSLRAGISTTIAGPTCPDNVWTGNSSTNWDNINNWSTGVIPNANNNVLIPGGRPRYPSLSSNAGANNLVMEEGSSINLNGRLFTIRGAVTAHATAKINASAYNSTLYMSGSVAQTIPNGLIDGNTIYNFTTENAAGVTTNSPLIIPGLLRVRQGNFNTNNMVTLPCSFSPRRTGQVAALDGTITGTITTEQCFPARRAYRFVASSVTTTTSIRANWQEGATAWNNNPHPGYGTHITGVGAEGSNPGLTDGVNGFDWQPSGTASMFTFNSTNQTWNAVTSTTGSLTAGRAYRLMVRGSRDVNIQLNASAPSDTKLRATGNIVKGPITITGLPATNGSYALVGNPFQAVVDLKLLIGNSYNLSNFVYMWDPTLGGTPVVGQTGGRGGYVSVNASNGAKSVSTSGASRYLMPYQSMFVQTTALSGAPQLTFRESDKLTTVPAQAIFGTLGRPFINLNLFHENAPADGTAADGVRIDFGDDENNDFDYNDAVKFTNSDENIARAIGTNLSSMENRAMPVVNEELPLSVTQYRRTGYIMKLELGHFENMEVYLKDNYLNQETLLLDSDLTEVPVTVNSTIPASVAANRFSIAFRAPALGTDRPELADAFSVFPNPVSTGELFVNAATAHDAATVTVYNTLGQAVYSAERSFTANNQIAVPVSTLTAGIYILKVKAENGAVYSTKFIKE